MTKADIKALSHGEREEFESLLELADADFRTRTAVADSSLSSGDSDALLRALAKMTDRHYPPAPPSHNPRPSNPSEGDSTTICRPKEVFPSIRLPSKDIEVRNDLPPKWKVDARTVDLDGGKGVLVVIAGFSSKEEFAAADVRV